MRQSTIDKTFSYEKWNCGAVQLSKEIASFISEFYSFSPEWFVEVKYHLLKSSVLEPDTRNDLCSISISSDHCAKCEDLYIPRHCLLWKRLFKLITWKAILRAPPCIRSAYQKRSIKTVATFMKQANLIFPPHFEPRTRLTCEKMRRWGHCDPDDFCHKLTSNNPLDYYAIRDLIKTNQ